MKFLEKVVEDILKIPDFYKDIFLFPNKRSVLYFEKNLKSKIDKPILFPLSLSLRDFVFRITSLNKLDHFNLTFELFEVYKEIFHNEKFEEFFLWSQILLKDFEEIDLSNNSSRKVLSNVAELQKIDAYVDSFSKSEASEYRKKYFLFWNKLTEIYKKFVTNLVNHKKSSYYGYALKYLVHLLKKDRIKIKGRNLYFIGFSDLQPLEIEFIKIIIKQNRAQFYFDVDKYFFYNEIKPELKNNEVQRLFNKYTKDIPIEKHELIEKNPIEIVFIPCNNDIEQFKFCQHILSNSLKENTSNSLEDYAIILNDSNHLEVLLNSLPQELECINISLGYSIEKTHIIKLILILLEQKIVKNPSFLVNLYKTIIHEPYFQIFVSEENEKLSPLASNPNIFHELKKISFFSRWLDIENPQDAIELFQSWIESLISHETLINQEVENQELYYAYLFLEKIKNNLNKININLEWNTFYLIFKQLLQTEFIPFSGEPLKGLQVIELQESQCLDFKYVFLMQVNEGLLPKSPDYSSFIAMELKKHYKLRTPEDFDARYAYLFYRLFHRSEKVFIFYNQNENQEESRFIKQIRYLFKDMPNIKMNTLLFKFSSFASTIQPIIIEKNNPIYQKIIEKLLKGISPTAFISYLNCSLKFYYSYIEKIQEEETLEEDLQANEFGNIVHKVLETFYKSLNTNKIKTIPTFDVPIEKLKITNISNENLLNFYNEMKKTNYLNIEEVDGKDYFSLEVIKEICQKIIIMDYDRYKEMHCNKVTIYGLEKNIEKIIDVKGQKVKLYGKIDKIEKFSNYYLIIDYKTGKISNKLKLTQISELKENIHQSKETFQLLFYAMLLSHELGNKNDIHLAIYSFRNLSKGLLYLQNAQNLSQNEWLNYKYIKNEFEKFIFEILTEILNPFIPFQQTTNEKNCKYCPYLKNCGKFHLLN